MLRDNQNQPVGVTVISIITFYFPRMKIAKDSENRRRIFKESTKFYITNIITNFFVLPYLLKKILYKENGNNVLVQSSTY